MSKRILDLNTISSASNDDYLVVDGSSGTRKITPENIVGNSAVAQTLANNISSTSDDIEEMRSTIGSLQSAVENIPSVDATLSMSGEAADALETGKIKTAVTDLGLNQNLGYLSDAHDGKGLSNNAEFSNQWLSYTDYIEIPTGAVSITVRTKTKTTSDVEYNITPFVYVYDEDYNVLYSYGDTTLAEEKTRSLKYDGAKYVRVVQPSAKALKTKYIKFNMYDAESADAGITLYGGYVTQDNYQDFFTDANNAPLNKAYGIQAVIDPAMIANLPEYHMATQANLITLCGRHPSEGNGNMNALQIYSVGSGGKTYIRTSDFTRTTWSKWAEMDTTPVYHVGSDKEYTSFTQCLYDLRNDNSEKIIYVDGGVYDIAQEYIDANIPVIPDDGDYNNNYTPYNVWIPENTHVIGLGNVVLRYMPDSSAVTEAQSKTVSPLNIHKSCTVENVTVECKNGRYCLHADGQGDSAYSNANIRLKNVRFIHYINDTDRGWGEVVGIGLDKQQTLIFEDCIFESKRTTGGANFYAHNRNLVGGVALTEAESSMLICKNCAFIQPGDTSNLIRLSSAVTTNLLQIETKFIGCYIGGTIHLMERTAGAPNCFDVTVLNSGNPTIVVDDSSNTYPVNVYG